MDEQTKPKVTRLEFWGISFALFSFIFAVHMSSTIRVGWFHSYVAFVIIVAQLVCLLSFLKYLRKK